MKLEFNRDLCNLCGHCVEVCPFGAIDSYDTYLEFNAACKLCRICVKQCPQKAIYQVNDVTAPVVDKSQYTGVLVVVEHHNGQIHPVTYELIGKARELADKLSHPVYCVMLGAKVTDRASQLLAYGVNKVFVFDQPELAYFRIEPYTNAIEDVVNLVKPSIILVGATPQGRSLAPRVAVRFKTGLTADCTILDVKDNSDLVQIRPAFGGNIMAQIVTPNNRPQLATVRYQVMDAAAPKVIAGSEVVSLSLSSEKAKSGITVLESKAKPEEQSIADAEIVVAVGRGIKEQKDMELAERLAKALGGMVGVTRPLVEVGWADHTRQIGLSGRTVRPKLLITIGISGAVQFSASVGGAEMIIAINKDESAPIFNIAHLGLVGDLYEIIPRLLLKLEEGGQLDAVL